MSKDLVAVFMGTPMFAVPIFEALSKRSKICLVVTQPDKPVGRGRKMDAPPVKKAAIDLGIEVIQPVVTKGKRFTERIAAYRPDVIVTAAFGKMLGSSLLSLPRLGCLNVHASLLPYYRGAAPINWAILNCETRTGVSIMRMDEGLDTGDAYPSLCLDIDEEETSGELTLRMAELGARALVDILEKIETIKPTPQRHDAATYAPMLKKSDGQIDWRRTARELHCHVRGMHPWPCATTILNDQPMKVHSCTVIDNNKTHEKAGLVIAHSEQGIDVACGVGVLRLVDVQLPGKKRLSSNQFYAGKRLECGMILGKDL